MTIPRLVSVGATCLTTIYRVDAIPAAPGKALAHQAARVTDGMAISAACAFQRLGGHAAIWARVGSDAQGKAMKAELAETGVEIGAIRECPGGKSSHASVTVDAKGERIVIVYHDPGLDPDPAWLPLDDLAKADFVHSDVRWIEGSVRTLTAARTRGVRAMLDAETTAPDILATLVPLATHAVFSDAGLAVHTGIADVEQGLRDVVARKTHAHVGASCGAKGYYWIEDGVLRHVPAPRIDAVDTLAAGDVFHGALALGLAEGRSVEQAARLACAAASLKCTKFGGRLGCPTREEAEAFMRGA
ncbi:MAG: ribokinase [Tagaea sp. CACIAM 22H2]|nr:ribokinase [Tagaea sp. CACIAM 22H2]